MKRVVAILACLVALATGHVCAQESASGVLLDQPWKLTIYELAKTKFIHPAWGWQHGERNYLLALQLAQGDHLDVDHDVLFAACMLHDMGAFPPYQNVGEHGDVAAVESEKILRDAGFPMEKFPKVARAMRAHMYYSKVGTEPESIVLHDADSLDFLGSIGAVRIIALTGASAGDADKAVRQLRGFLSEIPPKIITKTGQAIAQARVAELKAFLDGYAAESFGEKLP